MAYMMRIHLEQQDEMEENEKTFVVVSHLAKESRAFILNEPEADRDTVEKLFTLLSKRFDSRSSSPAVWPSR